MANTVKIDREELHKLVNENKSLAQIADYFQCSKSAVSAAKRELGLALIKKNTKTAAPLIIADAHKAKDELSSLVAHCKDEMAWIKENVPKGPTDNYMAWEEAALKHVDQIRKVISALADIEYKLNHVETVQKALLVMIEEIGKESLDCQQRIKLRLEKAKILL